MPPARAAQRCWPFLGRAAGSRVTAAAAQATAAAATRLAPPFAGTRVGRSAQSFSTGSADNAATATPAPATADPINSTADGGAPPLQGTPPPPLKLIYSSAQPLMVLWAARLLWIKGVACAVASATMLAPHLAATRLTLEGLQFEGAAVGSLSTDGPIGLGLAATALLARALSRRITTRTVLRLELIPAAKQQASVLGPPEAGGAAESVSSSAAAEADPRLSTVAGHVGRQPSSGNSESVSTTNSESSSDGTSSSSSSSRFGFVKPPEPLKPAHRMHCLDDTLVITHLRLWGDPMQPTGPHRTVARRGDIDCAPRNTTFQCFLLSRPGSSRQVPQYLFPVLGTMASQDLQYLKTMMYGDYFRQDEAPPPPDVTLISIEGFGPYRPAQFADYRHPLFPPSVRPGSEPAPVTGTPFFTQHGAVWANFALPPRQTLAEQRAAERDTRLYGAAPVPTRALPSAAAPLTLMLDGSSFAPSYALVSEHLKKRQQQGKGGQGVAAAVGEQEGAAAGAGAAAPPTRDGSGGTVGGVQGASP